MGQKWHCQAFSMLIETLSADYRGDDPFRAFHGYKYLVFNGNG